jgi:hypothetical protein
MSKFPGMRWSMALLRMVYYSSVAMWCDYTYILNLVFCPNMAVRADEMVSSHFDIAVKNPKMNRILIVMQSIMLTKGLLIALEEVVCVMSY